MERPHHTADEPPTERREWHLDHVLLAIVATLLLVGFLTVAATVMLPFAFAIFLIAVS